MGLVVNDIVKMEWDDKYWLQGKAAGDRTFFIFACKNYETSKGTIPVFFNAFNAWVFSDDEGLWTFEDARDFITENYDEAYPNSYEGYEPIFEMYDESVDVADKLTVEKYDLKEHLPDILARLQDLEEFGIDHEVEFE